MRTLRLPNISKIKDYSKNIDRRKLGIYTLIVLIFLRFVVYPMKENVENQKQKLQDKLQEYMQNVKLYTSRNIKQPAKKLEHITISVQNLHKIDEKSRAIQIHISKLVKEYAKKEKLNIQSIELPKPVKGKYIEQIDVKVRLSTQNPYTVYSLFQYLEAMPKYTVIRETQINTIGNMVNFYFTITTYKLVKNV